jgi:hypothetical protein
MGVVSQYHNKHKVLGGKEEEGKVVVGINNRRKKR